MNQILTDTKPKARDFMEYDGRKLRINMHPGQLQAWDSQARYPVILAGTQSGKTSWGSMWLDREIRKNGDGDYLAVTATYDLYKLKMFPEMRNWFIGVQKAWDWQASDRVFVSKDQKKRIILRAASSEEGLEAATANAAWFDEAGQDSVRIGAWEAVQRRLSLSQGRCLISTTPYNMGWLKTQVYDRWASGDKDFDIIQFKSIMNPKFPPDEYYRMRAKMPAWKFAMMYDGEFRKPAGMIYEDFDPAKHVINPMPIPSEWETTTGIDFGAVNTGGVWVARDPEKGCYYLFSVYLGGNRTTEEHVREFKAFEQDHAVVKRIGGARAEKQQRWDWSAFDYPVYESPVIDVEAGIDRVTALIKQNKLFIFNTCVHLIDELGTYARELDDNRQPTEKIKDKNTYHLADALRYCATGLSDGELILFEI
jgi:hypothetical protein